MAGKKIAPYVGDSVLEIGAGLGNMKIRLLPKDRYVCGETEPLHLHGLRNLFCRRPNINVKELDISSNIDHWETHEKFDTVLCLNVLEHIEDHVAALSNMNRLLSPGERIIINSPALYSSLDVSVGHKRRYRKKEIKSLVKDTGLQLEHAWEFNRIGVLGWIWNGKIRHRSTIPRLQLKIFDSLVWLWKLIDPYLPWPGQSIITVAKKPK